MSDYKIAAKLVKPLGCDTCGKQIGFVHEFDLHGSYFYCAECIDEVHPDNEIHPPSIELLRKYRPDYKLP